MMDGSAIFPAPHSAMRKAQTMLIISIIMFVRKKTKIKIAYILLASASLSIVGYDASLRSNPSVGSSEAQRAQAARPPMPLPITPLALSPFPEARPGHALASGPAVASTGRPSAEPRKTTVASSTAWFLTVAVKVDSGAKSVALNRGTRVHLVREQDGKFLVRRNGTDFLIEKTQITDDIGSLTKLARNSS